MPKFLGTVSSSALASFLAFGVMSAPALAADLSKYQNFQFGADLRTIANQVGASPSQAKAIQRRPALIQELEWRPQPLGPSSQTESANEVIFSFYDGELFRIAINYDRYETEGLTGDDFIESISATYGTAEMPPLPPMRSRAVRGSGPDRRTMAGFAVLFRPDPLLVWPEL